MRRIAVGCVAIALFASSCIDGSGSDERTVFVDYSHDEFASFMIRNFPDEVTVTPGDTVVFKQIWTGEPHTVTGGTLVNEMMERLKNWMPFFDSFDALLGADIGVPDAEDPGDATLQDVFDAVEKSGEEPNKTKFFESYDALVKAGSKLPPRKNPGGMSFAEAVDIVNKESEAAFGGVDLPSALDDNEESKFHGFTQNAGQKCFLERGAPPKKAAKPCTKAQQKQPVFDGTQTYYNSGVIPYEGPQGNTYKVEFAPDTKPGNYFFYCAVHGPGQFTEVNVKPKGTKIPSQESVSRTARKEIETFSEPMLKAYRDARDGTISLQGQTLQEPFAGLTSSAHGSVNEFLPKTIRTKVGQEVTWKMMGSDHTISFDVPEYFPIIKFAKNGDVSMNPKLNPPSGGSPEIPEQEGRGVLRVDGGTYDGSGFFSSGLFGAEPYAEYTLRFSKPGSYKYACLLHPPMVGTVVVR